jgi:hypothetical protein
MHSNLTNCCAVLRPGVLLLLTLFALSGCGAAGSAPGSRGITPGAPAARPAGLPRPLELRRASQVIVNVVDGADFDPQVAGNATVAGTNANFAPTVPAGSPAALGLAYAAYALQPDVATVAPLLHLAWRNAPQPGQCWIGLGDFQRNIWVWQPWTAGQDLPLDLQTLNIDSQTGTVPCVVLLTGNGPAQLGRVRIGANLPPQPQLQLLHAQGPAPLALTADCSASYDPDGIIQRYEYDLDGDGTVDQTTSQPVAHWSQPVDGSYQCYVRMIDDDGADGSAVVDYDSGFHHSWTPVGGTGNAQYTGVAALPGGGYYAYGYGVVTQGGTKLDAILLKYGAQGNLLWVRTLGNAAESDFSMGVAAAPDGGAFVSGVMNIAAGGGTLVVAHFLPDGTLDWQRGWGSSKVFIRGGLAFDAANNRLYACCAYELAASNHLAVLQSYDASGQWQWTRGWNSGTDTYCAGVGVDALGNAYLGMTFLSGAYLHCGVVEFDGTGTQLAKAEAGDPGFGLQANALAVNAAGHVALVGEYMAPAAFGPFAIVLEGGFSQDYAYVLPNPGNEDFFNACRFSPADGRLWAAGILYDTPDYEGGLAVFHPNGLNRQVYRFDAPGGKAGFAGLDLPAGGGVLLAANNSGPTGLDPLERDTQPLTYTLSVPAMNAVPDNSMPAVSTYASATPPDGHLDGPGDCVVQQFYQPLE